jgi:excisionase family DNA binding protein
MTQLSTGFSRHEKRARTIARPSPSAPRLAVSPLEAARLLSIGLSRLYRLLRAGELESFACGRARRVTVQSIEAYIARRIAADSARWHQLNPQPPQRRESAAKARESV